MTVPGQRTDYSGGGTGGARPMPQRRTIAVPRRIHCARSSERSEGLLRLVDRQAVEGSAAREGTIETGGSKGADRVNGIVSAEAMVPDEAAPGFSAVLGIELDRAYRVAGHLLGSASDAEDAVQEALERAWVHWPQLREPAAAQGWFWRILVNTCRSKLRKRRSQPVREIDDSLGLETPDPFRTSLARDAVGRAMSTLTDDQRLVVVLRYWGDLTVPEIARRTGLREGTVKSRLHAAHAALRRRLVAAGEAEA